MANPFFSGRIPPGLAIQIDAHLLITGETRSELLVRLLRSEVGDNKLDNKADDKASDLITSLLSRVERLEQLIGDKFDNNTDNVPDNKPDSIKTVAAVETEPAVISLTMKALAERLKVSERTLRLKAETDESWRELMATKPDPESLQWSRPVKVGKTWRIDCLALV